MKDCKYVGQRAIRPDSISKVTGRAKYASDYLAGRSDVLIAKVLRLPCVHARITGLSVDRARNAPDVVAVITAAEIAGGKYGYIVKDKLLVANNEIISDGDPVAIIVARTEAAANLALRQIEVRYEVLPANTDVFENMRPDASPVRQERAKGGNGNISNDVRVARGDMERAERETCTEISVTFRTPIVEHASLERDIAIAEPDPVNGGLTFYSPVQNVHGMREGLSEVLALPVSKIRVISAVLGGGFGGKECSSVDCGAVAGAAALYTGRPVVYEMSREEVFKYTSKRHKSTIKYRIGADQDGNITKMQSEAVFEKGAYKSVDVIPHRSALLSGGIYSIPAASVRNISVYANHVYCGAFRGLGAPQQLFALESAVDDLARTLGKDPFEFRLQNALKDGDTTIFSQRMDGKDEESIRACIRKVKEALAGDTGLEEPPPYIRRGKGVACYMYGCGSSFPKDAGHAYLELNVDGSLNVNLAQNEMGQGLLASMRQIAAEAIGIPVKDVNIGFSDSISAPESGPTSASRATVFQGNAVVSGCTSIKKRLLKLAAESMQEDADCLEIREGVIFSVKDSRKRISLKEIAAMARVSQVPLAEVGNWYPPMTEKDPSNLNQTTRWVSFAYGAHGVVVDVDTRNGMIAVRRSVHAIDVGKAINPSTVEGQIDGGTGQAFGWATMEEVFLKEGVVSQKSLHEYLIPTAADMPHLDSVLIESGSGQGPYGSKGIGEATILSGAPAIRNAVLDATGIAFYEIPLTPVRVMKALKMFEGKELERGQAFFVAPLEKPLQW